MHIYIYIYIYVYIERERAIRVCKINTCPKRLDRNVVFAPTPP